MKEWTFWDDVKYYLGYAFIIFAVAMANPIGVSVNIIALLMALREERILLFYIILAANIIVWSWILIKLYIERKQNA